ncbi:phosphonate degradation operons associated HDIG domain protein [Variovorax sp. PBS-H4]|uniref:HD domain-containing protein n=1 Tax=Variovorax sp. PBS-H4 TaxID=434008 RepID=UPI001315EE90|nr:HD domain-containing protein [Variovorax sp. PBS-H4]VTU41185.1 phosphonate degradation operons associated HDIG domain protein [Variovorax sp. PBS-H4]
MALELEDIRALFDAYGSRAYGNEDVTQLEHALQTAYLAESEAADRALIVAAFLHDLGHLIGMSKQEADGAPRTDGVSPFGTGDDLHQYVALPFLRPVFPSAVVDPIGLHVEAKRCLCAIDPTYRSKLSPLSIHTLELQGGTYTQDEADAFQSRPFASDAMRLRRWDDAAKVPGAKTPPFEHYFSMLSEIYAQSTGGRAAH